MLWPGRSCRGLRLAATHDTYVGWLAPRACRAPGCSSVTRRQPRVGGGAHRVLLPRSALRWLCCAALLSGLEMDLLPCSAAACGGLRTHYLVPCGPCGCMCSYRAAGVEVNRFMHLGAPREWRPQQWSRWAAAGTRAVWVSRAPTLSTLAGQLGCRTVGLWNSWSWSCDGGCHGCHGVARLAAGLLSHSVCGVHDAVLLRIRETNDGVADGARASRACPGPPWLGVSMWACHSEGIACAQPATPGCHAFRGASHSAAACWPRATQHAVAAKLGG